MKRKISLLLLITFFASANSLQLLGQDIQSPHDQLSELALSYAKAKNYNMAAETYLKEIEIGQASSSDYLNLGKVYYNLHNYILCDSILTIYNQKEPSNISGYIWRARALVNLDPDSKMGLPGPVYEIIIDKTNDDQQKFKKERFEAFYYFAYYNFVRYSDSKDKEVGLLALDYAEKALATDPENNDLEKVSSIIKSLNKHIKR